METFIIDEQEYSEHLVSILELGATREPDPARWCLILKMAYEGLANQLGMEVISQENHEVDSRLQ